MTDTTNSVIGNMSVPRPGFGAMRLSDAGVVDPIGLIRRAVALGVRFIDTADVYGPDAKSLHHNESLVAEALRGLDAEVARSVVVATKVGLARKGTRWMPEGDPKALTRAAEKSLKALGRNEIDLLQLHVRDPRVPFEDSLGALIRMYEKGRIKSIGLCNTTLGNLATALALVPDRALVSVQNSLSPLVPADAAEAAMLLPLCAQLGLAFIAHSPFGGREKSAGLAAHKAIAPLHAALVRDLGDAAPDAWTMVLAWLMTISPHIMPIFGTTRFETLEATLGARSWPLPDPTRLALDKAFPAFAALRHAVAPVAVNDFATARTLATTCTTAREPGGDEVILTVGVQAAGKSSAINPFIDAGYLRLNRDERGGKLEHLIPPLSEHLKTAPPGARTAILDNTYATARARAPVIAAAKAAGVPVRAIWLDTPLHEARINAVRRMLELTGGLQGPDELKQLQKQHENLIPPAAQTQFLGILEPPTLLEGFAEVERRPFVRRSNTGTKKGLLLDVDGTLRLTLSGDKYPISLDDFEIRPGRKDVLSRWVAAGWHIHFVSNQSGVASGKVSHDLVTAIMQATVTALGVPVDDIAFCPHPAFPVGCFCRKPLPGLGVMLIDKHGLDTNHLVMVGDMNSDAGFAEAIGARYFDADVFFGSNGPDPT